MRSDAFQETGKIMQVLVGGDRECGFSFKCNGHAFKPGRLLK